VVTSETLVFVCFRFSSSRNAHLLLLADSPLLCRSQRDSKRVFSMATTRNTRSLCPCSSSPTFSSRFPELFSRSNSILLALSPSERELRFHPFPSNSSLTSSRSAVSSGPSELLFKPPPSTLLVSMYVVSSSVSEKPCSVKLWLSTFLSVSFYLFSCLYGRSKLTKF